MRSGEETTTKLSSEWSYHDYIDRWHTNSRRWLGRFIWRQLALWNWSHERNPSECQEHLYLLHIMYILPNTKSAWWHHFIAPLSTIKMMSSCALSNTYSYIFSRMLKDGSCWHRSSLNSVASCLERCCPVADTNALMKNLQLSTIYILFSCITYVCIHQCLYQIRNNQICQQLKEYTLCKNFPP